MYLQALDPAQAEFKSSSPTFVSPSTGPNRFGQPEPPFTRLSHFEYQQSRPPLPAMDGQEQVSTGFTPFFATEHPYNPADLAYAHQASSSVVVPGDEASQIAPTSSAYGVVPTDDAGDEELKTEADQLAAMWSLLEDEPFGSPNTRTQTSSAASRNGWEPDVGQDVTYVPLTNGIKSSGWAGVPWQLELRRQEVDELEQDMDAYSLMDDLIELEYGPLPNSDIADPEPGPDDNVIVESGEGGRSITVAELVAQQWVAHNLPFR